MNDIREKAALAVQKSAAVSAASKQNSTISIIKDITSREDVKARFQTILGKKSNQFLASITSLVASSSKFSNVDPNTVMAAAMVAATMDLPINANLGFAYIIPYKEKAQFQMGYKGFIQLALRSGQFKTINATEVYEGELVSLNRLTGLVVMDESARKSQKVVGYAAYFQLLNGFEKTLYMSSEQLRDHGKRFSKTFYKEDSLWHTDFHSMAMKTVLKLLLSKYGILSVDMQRALEVDQAVLNKDGAQVEYVDLPGDDEGHAEGEGGGDANRAGASTENADDAYSRILGELDAVNDLAGYEAWKARNDATFNNLPTKLQAVVQKAIGKVHKRINGDGTKAAQKNNNEEQKGENS